MDLTSVPHNVGLSQGLVATISVWGKVWGMYPEDDTRVAVTAAKFWADEKRSMTDCSRMFRSLWNLTKFILLYYLFTSKPVQDTRQLFTESSAGSTISVRMRLMMKNSLTLSSRCEFLWSCRTGKSLYIEITESLTSSSRCEFLWSCRTGKSPYIYIDV